MPLETEDGFPPRPVTGIFVHLTPKQRAAALAYRGPENIGEAAYRLDAPANGPATSVHSGDGGEARRRQSAAMEELIAMRADEVVGFSRSSPHGGLAGTIAMHRIGVDVGRLDNAVQELGYESYTASCVGIVLDACASIMAAAGPLGMTSSEPWEESDDDYAQRLGPGAYPVLYASRNPDVQRESLNVWGAHVGILRPRLTLMKE